MSVNKAYCPLETTTTTTTTIIKTERENLFRSEHAIALAATTPWQLQSNTRDSLPTVFLFPVVSTE